MINSVVLSGRIVRDLELKYSNSGAAVLNFNIAVERAFKNANGERETDFINIVAFKATAENIAKYLKKGDGIGIVGRIQTGSYENKNGQKVYTTDVVADQFDFPIQNKKQDGQQQKAADPFVQSAPPAKASNFNINDDNLPF
jgi:single-strand DNA-binding protein